ncbi:MAG: redoxin family protein [bacterium]|nr:redoxin family protein [bacterium]
MPTRIPREKLGWAALLALATVLVAPLSAAATVDVAGLTHLDGTAITADEVSENALFVVFSTWSPKCRGIVELVNEIHSDWGDRAQVFLVNFQEDAGAVEKFLAGRKPKVKVLLDPDASFSKKHKITYLPSLLAVRDGSPAFRGKLPSDVGPVLRPIFE